MLGKGRIEFTGFDMQTPDVAMQMVLGFVDKVDRKYAKTVAQTYATAMRVDPAVGGAGFGFATGTFPVEAAAGRQVRYSGYIKTDGVAGGHAGLWWRVDGESGILGFDNMHDRGPRGTGP
jgi:hypothetical protein